MKSRRFLVPLVASTAVALLPVITSPADATFPGLNGVIACESNRTGNFEIFTFGSTGTEVSPTNLTNSPSADTRPKFSPDGQRIAFTSDRDGSSDIWVMNANGTGAKQLTFTAVGVNNPGSWSPDGEQLVFQSSRDGNFEIYKINIDGSGETRLTNNPAEDSLPVWSSDGLTIAFSSRQVDPVADVHLMDVNGTILFNVTNNPGVEDSSPTWAPDGSQIAFHSRRDDADGLEIYRIAPNGTGVVRLTTNDGGTATSDFDAFPVWSPAGDRIAWNSGRNGSIGDVYTMRSSDGGDIVRITSDPATDQRCDWQPMCTITGSGYVFGTAGDDRICGGGGPDTIYGGGGDDVIFAGAGPDRVFAGSGHDTVYGGAGTEQIYGEDGDDKLFGGADMDRILGGAGFDVANGGADSDQCVAESLVSCP